MKRLSLIIALLALPVALFADGVVPRIEHPFTGSAVCVDNAPEWVKGTTKYVNITPGGQRGNLVIVNEAGKPGVWDNAAGDWYISPYDEEDIFFASPDKLFCRKADGRASFFTVYYKAGDAGQELYSEQPLVPLYEDSYYYPSRENPSYICYKMGGKWGVMDSFAISLLPPSASSAKEAVSLLKRSDDKRQRIGESDLDYIMRCFSTLKSYNVDVDCFVTGAHNEGVYIS